MVLSMRPKTNEIFPIRTQALSWHNSCRTPPHTAGEGIQHEPPWTLILLVTVLLLLLPLLFHVGFEFLKRESLASSTLRHAYHNSRRTSIFRLLPSLKFENSLGKISAQNADGNLPQPLGMKYGHQFLPSPAFATMECGSNGTIATRLIVSVL